MAQRRRQRTEVRREQIAEAALRIIGTRGVHRLTAMELGAEVGISDGAIFRHFKDKAAIVDAAIEHLAGLLFEGFPPAEADPIDRLQIFFLERLRRVKEHPGVLRLAFTDRLAEAAGEASAARVRELMARSTRFVRDCLAEAQREGLLDPSLPLDALTWIVTGTLQAAALSERQAAGRGDPEQLWDTLEKLLRRSRPASPGRKRGAAR